MKYLLLITCLALTGCYDPGGSIAERERVVAAELKTNTPVRLPRNCDSACTMQLADPDVCIQRTGSIGVHAANVDGIPNEAWTEVVFSYYYRYPAFQSDIRAHGAMSTLKITVYSASSMHSFGVPYCK